jgi:hypothetical protein
MQEHVQYITTTKPRIIEVIAGISVFIARSVVRVNASSKNIPEQQRPDFSKKPLS